jgi:60 kDa SS-A/Ro ribonucleoprotein
MAIDNGIRELRVSPRMRLDTVLKNTSNINGGGTDCALPMVWALENKTRVVGFSVYTDNETWAGHIHPAQALWAYRDAIEPEAKEVVVGMTSSGFTIADPNDNGMLDVCGFDASVPSVIADFVRDDTKAA